MSYKLEYINAAVECEEPDAEYALFYGYIKTEEPRYVVSYYREEYNDKTKVMAPKEFLTRLEFL